MKMEEEKKSKLTDLLIVILGGVAIILIILLLVRSRGVVTPVTRYNDYEDHLIQITKEEQIDVKANIYDDKKSLAVLLASQLEENHLANIQVKVIDENEKEIYQKEEKVVLLGAHVLPEIQEFRLPREFPPLHAPARCPPFRHQQRNQWPRLDHSFLHSRLLSGPQRGLRPSGIISLSYRICPHFYSFYFFYSYFSL